MVRPVEIIAPRVKPKFLTDGSQLLPEQRRVAAYCRVSTLSEEQNTSYDNQVEEWTKRINENPNYVLVDIYTDHGISGTSLKRREGFNRMIEDARAGKIDLILTKSISRFARNVMLTVSLTRELKELGVEVYFDNEGISSLDPKSEALFTILSTMSQEESRHMSENIKWTFDKKMREGIPFICENKFLGYRKDPNDERNLIIVPEEAEVVKLIYKLYTSGVGTCEIARILMKKGYKTGAKKDKWYSSTVEGIIKNEKYCGDILLQKTITVDYLSHKRVKNDGIAQKYYIKDNHEPIIDRDTWDRAQEIFKANKAKFKNDTELWRYTIRYPLSGLIVCNHCGKNYRRRHWTQGYPTPRIMYQCTGYVDNDIHERCSGKPISEDILLKASCEVINKVYLDKTKLFAKILKLIEKHVIASDDSSTIEALEDKQSDINEEIDEILKKKGTTTDKSEIYFLDRRYRELINEFHEAEKKLKLANLRQQSSVEAQTRLQNIREILKSEQITPELLSKQVLQACIFRIVLIDREHIVFVLSTGDVDKERSFSKERKTIINNEPILTGTVKLDRHFRPETLEYKVVLL